MSELAALRDLVEGDLDDSANDTWTTAEIDRAIQRALSDYSHVRPQQTIANLTLTAAGRDVDISSLTSLIQVLRIYHPYTVLDPEDPPNWRRFEQFATYCTILDGNVPAIGDVVHVYYTKPQTIHDLAGSTAVTSVAPEHEELIVLGGGAYAAMEKARSAVVQAGISTDTPKHWLSWGKDRMAQFVDALRKIKATETLKLDKRVPITGTGWVRTDTREEI